MRCPKTIALYSLYFYGLLLYGCKDPDIRPPHPTKAARTVIVYMAANNNLRQDALNNINQMERAVNDADGNLIVYIKTSSSSSHLLRIRPDVGSTIISDTIKTYQTDNSADPEHLKAVIADAQEAYPADSYGLILWSHATSWAPPSGFRLKSFGLDDDTEMDIRDLKYALPDNLTYLIFDACSMASAEVVYELKDKASYILASPTETISEGYPYDQITPHLFGSLDGLKIVARLYFEYYNSRQGDYQSATVSLIQTGQLTELANRTKQLLENHPFAAADYNRDQIQRLDFDPLFPISGYDFLDFLAKNFDEAVYLPVAEQLEKSVIYKAHTTSFIGETIHAFSGLSCYIPRQNEPFYTYYKTLQWSDDSGFNHLFEGDQP